MTTTAHTTARARGAAEREDAGHVDVLIIGAGVSGIGVAHHLRDGLRGAYQQWRGDGAFGDGHDAV